MAFLLKLLELMAAGGLFGATLALPPSPRLRHATLAAAAALALTSLGRGLLWDFSPVHLMPLAAASLAALLAWRKLRLGLVLLAAVYLAWIAQRGW